MPNENEARGHFGEERRELQSLLAAPAFRRAPKLAHLLSFICERYFEGDVDALKEYSIGVGALGRDPKFDPEVDSIVRVEASRLRRRLNDFYNGEGANHPVQIHLPLGSYVPQFVRSEAAQPASEPEPPAQASRFHLPAPSRRIAIFGLGAIALVLLGTRVDRWPFGGPASHAGAAVTPQGTGAPPPDGDVIRILAGSEVPKYIDLGGRIWLGDRYFRGGTAISRPGLLVFRTMDPYLYRTAREGDFSYDIPLPRGVYELHLHFAEIVFGNERLDSGGDGMRRFDIAVNGRQIVEGFDIVRSAASTNTADELVVTDVTPGSDGYLHVKFSSVIEKALLSGIEIYRGAPRRMRALRLLAGARQYYDAQGQLWEADRYFYGGRLQTLRTAVEGAGVSGLGLTLRWGHFNYAIPVAPGQYTVRLWFFEGNFGLFDRGHREQRKGGENDRLMDVYCNGETLVRRLDVFKEAGGALRPLVKTFRGLRPNAQGKLMLTFVPVKDYAILNGIEVVAEEPAGAPTATLH